MKKSLLIILFLSTFISIKLHAKSEWLGRWQTNPIAEGTERVIMEYYFKNDSMMSLTFFTDNQISEIGRCVSEVSMDGVYKKIGPIFVVSLKQETLNVNLLKLVTHVNSSPISEKQIIKQIENSVIPLVSNCQDVSMIYVTHDNHDIISFIIGDENNALNIELHRPTKTIEQLYGLDEETIHDKIDNIDISHENTSLKHNDEKTLRRTKMLKSFGLFMLYLVLSWGAIFGIKVFFLKNLTRTNSAQKSVNIRLCYSVTRFILRIIVIVVGAILWVIFLINAIDVNNYIALTVLCGGGGLLLHLLSSLSLPMNFMTMKKFMKKERAFVLYLRGFITDNYSPSMENTADIVSNAVPWNTKIGSDVELQPNELTLNEKSLAKAWKKYYQPYSVGLPEELESPEGTRRIYLDNDSWQEDAKTLMKLAKYILVCIHPNDNCIWEIRQCNTFFPEKTIYYIDDITNLSIVKKKLGEDLPACLKSETIDHNHVMAFQKDSQVVLMDYSNTATGLINAVSRFFS